MNRSGMDIPRVTRTLLAHQNRTHTSLAEHMHIGPSLLSKKLAGLRGWSVDDIAAMADFFDVEPELFFDDPENLVRTSHGRPRPDDNGQRVTGTNTDRYYQGDNVRFLPLQAA